jgi:hypothetical protein
MLPSRDIETILRDIDPEWRDIILELRSLIVSAAPNASETFLWRGLTYFDKARGGPVKGGFCQIGIHRDHVRLEFLRGCALPDPAHLLRGDRKYKRYVRLTSFNDAPWSQLSDLVRASTRVDPATLELRPEGG